MTYTYVRYCSDDTPGMAELRDGYAKLAADFEARREAMHPKAARAFEHRLETLRHAWAMLLEPVPRSYGG